MEVAAAAAVVMVNFVKVNINEHTRSTDPPATRLLRQDRVPRESHWMRLCCLSTCTYIIHTCTLFTHSPTHHFNNGQGKLCSIIDASHLPLTVHNRKRSKPRRSPTRPRSIARTKSLSPSTPSTSFSASSSSDDAVSSSTSSSMPPHWPFSSGSNA